MNRTMDGEELRGQLKAAGAALVGFADLSAYPDEPLRDFCRNRLKEANPDHAFDAGSPLSGVAMAILLPPDIVGGLTHGPTGPYYEAYVTTNKRLDILAGYCVDLLRQRGFAAFAQVSTIPNYDENVFSTPLPHKTVATMAGLGWIGKNALLVNKEYGSAFRLISVMTDAPLPYGTPVTASRCGTCNACADECPAETILGNHWAPGRPRDTLMDPVKCQTKARQLSLSAFGVNTAICGVCFHVCPFTQRRLRRVKRLAAAQ
ncbi:MAG: hypothetical protein LBR29_02030 [Methylobacteriaceae bacterium]|jgi:epoxyqueuosine reductase QueG|nr:hypothetical protein [Methylobacteriaceae bacterium]